MSDHPTPPAFVEIVCSWTLPDETSSRMGAVAVPGTTRASVSGY
jgi:hypothetical protein